MDTDVNTETVSIKDTVCQELEEIVCSNSSECYKLWIKTITEPMNKQSEKKNKIIELNKKKSHNNERHIGRQTDSIKFTKENNTRHFNDSKKMPSS